MKKTIYKRKFNEASLDLDANMFVIYYVDRPSLISGAFGRTESYDGAFSDQIDYIVLLPFNGKRQQFKKGDTFFVNPSKIMDHGWSYRKATKKERESIIKKSLSIR